MLVQSSYEPKKQDYTHFFTGTGPIPTPSDAAELRKSVVLHATMLSSVNE